LVMISVVVPSMASATEAIFGDKDSEYRWQLDELNSDLPHDWSGYGYLTLEIKSSTAQRFELRIFTKAGVRKVRLQPFAGAWIRAALPLAYFEKRDQQGFDLASLG